jgi:hypothetical protein
MKGGISYSEIMEMPIPEILKIRDDIDVMITDINTANSQKK